MFYEKNVPIQAVPPKKNSLWSTVLVIHLLTCYLHDIRLKNFNKVAVF